MTMPLWSAAERALDLADLLRARADAAGPPPALSALPPRPRATYDRLLDAVNRLLRPLMVLGSLALLASALIAPDWFTARMEALSDMARGAVVDHRRGPVPPLRSALPGPRPRLPARGRHLRPAACADDHRLARLRRRAHHRHAHPRAEPCPRGLALHATVTICPGPFAQAILGTSPPERYKVP